MSKYLLDTNICVYFLNGRFQLQEKVEAIGKENCCISEITVAELMYGVERSTTKEKNSKTVKEFISKFDILPIFPSLEIYAKEKARLRKTGMTIEDFDLLIAATAVTNNLTMVTNNEKHFNAINHIHIENWTTGITK